MLEDIYYEGGRFLGAVFDTWYMHAVIILAQTLLIIASFALLAGIVFLLIKSNYYGPKLQKWYWFFDQDPEDTEKALAKTWEDIHARLSEPGTDYRELILDATVFMEQVFSSLDYPGEGVSEQLEHVTVGELPSKDSVRAAARKAQVMREDEEVRAAFQEAEMVIGAYDTVLHELGVTH